MDAESIAIWMYVEGYDYGTIASYANTWDCSFTEAMVKLFNIKFPS